MRIAPAAGLATLLLSTPAFAHHAMDGRLPTTFSQGLLSGLAHPVIGPDHLLALIAIGVLMALLARGVWLAVGFAGAALLGVGLHLLRVNLPASETLVAATVLLFGFALSLAFRRNSSAGAALPGWLMLLALVAGTLHGYAYGESIVGSHRAALGAYLLGLTAIQLAVILLVRALTARLLVAIPSARAAATLRLVSASTICIAGVVLLALTLRA